jgi:hypothetical protein
VIPWLYASASYAKHFHAPLAETGLSYVGHLSKLRKKKYSLNCRYGDKYYSKPFLCRSIILYACIICKHELVTCAKGKLNSTS